MKKAIFFDLDYTLFDTEDYYSAGLKAVSEYLQSENSVDSSVTFEFLLGLWKEKTSRYASLFDDVIEKFNLEVDAKKLVEIFNSVSPDLKPYDDATEILDLLENKHYLGIITDGNSKRQKRKIDILFGNKYFDKIICSGDLDSDKSSTKPFKLAKSCCDEGVNFYYVGDNPVIDFKSAKEEGFTTIRILRGEYGKENVGQEWIDHSIETLTEVAEIIK